MIQRKCNHISVSVLTTALFLLQTVCIAQKTTNIKGSLNSEGFSDIRIRRYSPDRVVQERLIFPVKNGNFDISLVIQKPEMIRIFNNYLLFSPDKNYDIKIAGRDLKIISEGINNALISKEAEYENLSKSFWGSYEKSFDISEYTNKIQDITDDYINKLIKSKLFFLAKAEETAILNYILSKNIFYYSLPFVSDSIRDSAKQQMAKFIFRKIVDISNTSFEDRSEYFDIALTNFYIKWLYKYEKGFSNIIQGEYWSVNDKLKQIIAGQFIQAYANNNLVLTKQELTILKNLMCESDTSKFEFCDYYINKIEYKDLLLDSIAKNDHLIAPEDSIVSLPVLFHDKNSYVYFWASWCVPCINFIRKLDMDKLAKDSSFAIIFLSIDDNKEAWRKVNLNLGVTAPSYLVKNGLKSEFAKKLKIDHVPFLININNNQIDKLNVPKEIFSKYFKQ